MCVDFGLFSTFTRKAFILETPMKGYTLKNPIWINHIEVMYLDKYWPFYMLRKQH